MAPTKSIVIVDDHPMFREGLKAIIGRDHRYEVIGEAGTGQKAVRMISRLKPDLVSLDVSLPDKSGLDLIADIIKCSPASKVLIVSMHFKTGHIAKAFEAGANGYVVKESATDRLLEGIAAVLNGEYFMDTVVSQQVIQKLVGLKDKPMQFADPSYETLTPREQQIMVLIAEGGSVKDIAEKLYISPKTVENHRSNIMNKLELQSTLELVRYAAKLGLIDIDLWKG